jgi:hypothetical protein
VRRAHKSDYGTKAPFDLIEQLTRSALMSSTKIQKLFFMFITVLLSVTFFVIYNISINSGRISWRIVPLALKEIPVEFIIAFLIQFLFAAKTAEKLALSVVDPKKQKPSMMIIARTGFSICIMCPSMSFAATILYNGINDCLVSSWLRNMMFNLPFAIVIQFFIIGPLVRALFGLIFRRA